jgi:hypothetical protein
LLERGTAARDDLASGGFHGGTGGWSARCAYRGFLGLLGSEGARTG